MNRRWARRRDGIGLVRGVAVLTCGLLPLCGCGLVLPEDARVLSDSGGAEAGRASVVRGEPGSTAPRERGRITIEGVGEFSFDAGAVKTRRPDIFRPGHFSVFDILVHLYEAGEIDLRYRFDRSADTHVVESLNGRPHWWYNVFYEGGWSERSVFRIDYYPYKDGMTVRVAPERADHLATIRALHREEFARYRRAGPRTTVDLVVISGPNTHLEFHDVEVRPYNLRDDMFHPGVVTAADVILSLGERGELSYDLDWVPAIGLARVQNYYVTRINDDEQRGRCGFVYEAGPIAFRGFRGNHIHLPTDARVIRSPEYVEFFWICI